MSMNHHMLAKVTTDSILAKFKSGSWKCCGNVGTNFYRVGCDITFPSPDAAFYDDGEELLVTFEFKPPTESKRGVLTGLGQSIAYLKSSNISYLVVPKRLEDFDIGKFMTDIYTSHIDGKLPLGLIIYDNDDPANVILAHNIMALGDRARFSPASTSRFWAKHQDMPVPLFHLILHCYYLKKTRRIEGDAFAYCWENYLVPKDALDRLEPAEIKDLHGETIKTLSGRKSILFLEKRMNAARKKQGREKDAAIEKLNRDADTTFSGDNYYNSLKKNFVTLLKHLELVDSTGNMTEDGFKMYHLGLANGPGSKVFTDYFLQRLLTVGHHLDLIIDIERLCSENRGRKTTREIKKSMLEDYETRGMIKRNPKRMAGAESTVEFLKYESILWNSMGLATKVAGKPDISFNWKRIVEVCSLPDL